MKSGNSKTLKLFENLVGLDPGNPKIIAGLLRCLHQLRRFDDGNEMFKSLDEEMLENEDISKIKKLFDATNNDNENVFDVKLIEEVNANPENMELRFKLANIYRIGLNSS